MAAEVIIPYAASGNGWWTGLAVTNIDSQGTGTVTVDFFSANGAALGTKTIGSISPGTFYVNTADGLFGTGLPSRFWMIVSHGGDARMAVTVFFGNAADGGFSTTVYRSDRESEGVPITTVPFIIGRSGHYYLTGNLQSTSTTGAAITCTVPDVTIDLKGFSLIGPGNSSGDNDGITARKNTIIKNGIVRSFGRYGIHGSKNDSSGYGRIQVLDVAARNCGKYGIRLEGVANVARNCQSMENGDGGIFVGPGSRVEGNVVSGNVTYGIFADAGSIVQSNISFGNMTGYVFNVGCILSGNTAYKNQNYGFMSLLGRSTLVGNSAYENGQYGIYSSNSLVDQNSALENGASGGGDNIRAGSSTMGVNHAP
ncbi:MAG: right-handed parallel beta-helix repeat-containing protein [Deltaproteobacteria bacterium]|nr:right-handed parallel beta-helix repeat-containing protein [Deltaproteobacteria bacterium]